ncbi:MAG: ISL3 family transposase [Holdemanella porci]
MQKIILVDHPDTTAELKIRLVPDQNISCPLCGSKVCIQGYIRKKLNHAILVNRKCIITYERRRYKCKSCCHTFCEANPFINTGESLTIETVVNVLKDLKYVNNTYTSVARRFNLSVAKVMHIFDKHVDIKRKTLPEVLSIDEHYFPSSDQDKSLYICVLMDFNTGIIVDVLPDRKKNCLFKYFSSIRSSTYDQTKRRSECDNVKFVSIDLYDTYKDVAQTFFPNAAICADPFHVIKHLNDSFNKVRIRCRKNTEDENIQYLLTQFKYIFKHNINIDNEAKYNKRFKRYLNYRDIMKILFERFPELETAYLLKEKYIKFNNESTIEDAYEKLKDVLQDFAKGNIPEYDEFYNMLVNWYDEIVNSFSLIKGRRINNSYIESRNNNIEHLMINAYGFRNFKRTRNRILYCLNKKDTYKI